ncbi:SDR family oxidoreductase [Bacillus sp. REN3]|uniref:SDR family oxidoreductase n=1 Tax=Bacillus sp. REN3 TaxID=2802440 RepID=UPI001AEE1A3C|nr:SDR family oxidoreductase [Bacillus sp. REN3]
MKNAVITGASSGFGKLIAIELAKAGFHVIATMRDLKKAEGLQSAAALENVEKRIVILSLDVTSQQSVNDFKKELDTIQSVDVLVNNAGFALGGFGEELSLDEFRQQFETNFFGTVAVSQAAIPYMRAKGSGKIINMSNISGRFGFPGLSAYVASKHALEGFSESLRLELRPFGIDVVLIEPGSYKTNIWSNVEKVRIHEKSPYKSAMAALLKQVNAGKNHQGEPLEVARAVVKIATSSRISKLRYPVGRGVGRLLFFKSVLPWRLIERIVMKRMQ